MKEKLPISIIIRTINEELNISDCIKACKDNNPEEIIVVDGGSKDKTREIAQQCGAKVVISERGLSNQRDAGVKAASYPYIAIVDADDRLKEDCLEKLLKEIKENNYDAIQAQLRNFYKWYGNEEKRATYLERAMDVNLRIIRSQIGPTTMVGRPALYKASSLKAVPMDPLFQDASEDSDLSYRFHQNGFKQGIGTGVSYRKHLSSFRKAVQKYILSGKGEALFTFRHPERLFATLKHELYVYPIKRSLKAIRNGYVFYAPFFVLVGWCRFWGFIKTKIKFLLKGKPRL